MGAPLMATQWGVECWCATEVEVDHERHGEGATCDYRCAGDTVGDELGRIYVRIFHVLLYTVAAPPSILFWCIHI